MLNGGGKIDYGFKCFGGNWSKINVDFISSQRYNIKCNKKLINKLRKY